MSDRISTIEKKIINAWRDIEPKHRAARTYVIGFDHETDNGDILRLQVHYTDGRIEIFSPHAGAELAVVE